MNAKEDILRACAPPPARVAVNKPDMWALPIDDGLVCLQCEPGGGWRVNVGSYESTAFVASSSFVLAASPQLNELVAVRSVVDATTGLVVPILAFRSSATASTAYTVGLLDLDECAFERWESVELTSMARRTEVVLCDGPVLCVLRALTEGGCELTVANCAAEAPSCEDAATDVAPPVGTRTTVLPFEARSLCAYSLSGRPDAMALLLLARAADREGVVSVALHPLRRPPGSATDLIPTPVQSSAIEALAGEVSRAWPNPFGRRCPHVAPT